MVGQVNDAITFNPMFAIETPEYNTMDMAYDTFMSWDLRLETSAGLAESWEQSEDGLTWTFQVKDGVTWSDGTPFTAHDVAATYNWILDEKVGTLSDYLPFTDRSRLPTTRRWCGRSPNPRVRRCTRRTSTSCPSTCSAPTKTRRSSGRGRASRHGRHRPVPARRVGARGLLADGGEPRLLGRRAEDRRARLPDLPERRVDDPGPATGRDRLRLLDREPGPVRVPPGRPRHHGARGGERLLRADEHEPVHRSRSRTAATRGSTTTRRSGTPRSGSRSSTRSTGRPSSTT